LRFKIGEGLQDNIFLARSGKQNVEGEGVEVCVKLVRFRPAVLKFRFGLEKDVSLHQANATDTEGSGSSALFSALPISGARAEAYSKCNKAILS
jgi:hypothetical protein